MGEHRRLGRRALLRAGVAGVAAGVAGCQSLSRERRDPPVTTLSGSRQSAPDRGDGWRAAGADAGNTGWVPRERGPLFRADVAWSATLGYGGAAAPVVGDVAREATSAPLVVVGDPGGRGPGLLALSLATGTVEWRFDCGPVTAAPALGTDAVYAVSGADQRVYAVDAATGTERWRASLAGYRGAAPTLADGTLYVGIDDTLVALDAADGSGRWQRGVVGYAGETTPAVAGRTVVLGGGGLTALDAEDGGVRWRALDGATLGTPTAVASGVFAVRRGSAPGVVALGPGGDPRWTRSLPVQRGVGGLTVTGGQVVVPTEDGVVALRRDGGDTRWAVTGEGRPLSPAAAAGSRLYLPWRANRTESLVSLSPAEGGFAWANVLGTDEPYDQLGPVAVADGHVLVSYVSSTDTTLLALGHE